MNNWSSWILLGCSRKEVFLVDYEGPGCYELGIICGQESKTMYVGESDNIRRRLYEHARSKNDNLARKILTSYNNGWHLYGHFLATKDKEKAKFEEQIHLMLYRYKWNKKGMNSSHRLAPDPPL